MAKLKFKGKDKGAGVSIKERVRISVMVVALLVLGYLMFNPSGVEDSMPKKIREPKKETPQPISGCLTARIWKDFQQNCVSS